MSTSRGSGAGNGSGVQLIPAGARKVVHSLKEIVNCPDAEIYAALKESNMDPNEAVNRLLTQDPFHEVKSKREKKKEGKDSGDFRSHGANNSSTRRSRNGADRHLGRGASAPYSSSEPPMHGKPTYKKENGSTPYKSNFSSAAVMSGNNRSQGPSGISDGSYAESKGSLLGTADGMPSAVQTASGYQSAWGGVPGQVSMADIVKMGRPQYKASHAPSASHHNIEDASPTESFPVLKSSADHASKVNQSEVPSFRHTPINHVWPPVENSAQANVSSVPEYKHEAYLAPPKFNKLDLPSFQHIPTIHVWPPVEKSAPANATSVPEYKADAELHPEESCVSDVIDHHYEAEEVQEGEDDNIGNSEGNDLASASLPSRKVPENDSRNSSLFENELYQNLSSYQTEVPGYDGHEGEEADASVSSVTQNFQELSVEKDDRGFPSEENTPSVVIPDHLQVQAADCSHLSFGSFGSSMTASYSSGAQASVPVKSNLEEGHSEAGISSAGHVDTRQSEYYIDDSIRNTPDRFHRNGGSAGTYDASSASQPEELKPESAEVSHGNQYPFPSANTGYALDNAQSRNAAFNENSSQIQNLAQYSNVMQSYPNALPSTLLTGNVHSARESDLQYSQFPVSHSMSAKYGNSVSSAGVSSHSMSEALKTANSSTQPAPQSLSGTNMPTGPPLPQHIAVHPYSQPTLPLGPYANMIGYPFLPQSYTYMPSAFQQSFAGNSTYHQSLAALLPQYKSSVSVSSLPQSAAIPSGYGNLANNATVPGNYPMNPPAAPSGSALNYEDVLNSQYKEASHLLSLQQQQNENQAMWLHGQGSRTVQAVPSNAYYNYQGQSQQPGGFRQAQQQSQNYGSPGYANFYHSQTGISLDQQQNAREGSLGAAQGQAKQSQIWPSGY